MRRTLAPALLLAALAGAAASAGAQPAPGTWAVGTHGVGPITFQRTFNAAPSLRYVATDRLSLEFDPYFSWQNSATGVSVNNIHDEGAGVAAIIRIADYRGFRLSGVIEPFYLAHYDSVLQPGGRFDNSKDPVMGLNGGLELEYFVTPEFSLGARGLLTYAYEDDQEYSNNPPDRNISRSLTLQGEVLEAHYYFNAAKAPSASGADASAGERSSGPSGTRPGAWSVGWMGEGATFGLAQPALKYVWTDKTAFEIMPNYSATQNTTGASVVSTRNYDLHAGVIRTIAASRTATFGLLLEPDLRYTYTHHSSATSWSNNPKWALGVGSGFQVEYFVLPDLSAGFRAVFFYRNTQSTTYSNKGYQGINIGNSLTLEGQAFQIRWYFR